MLPPSRNCSHASATRPPDRPVLAATLGFPGAARGQAPEQKPTIIPTIEVVATRRPQALHDVPASIEVIRGADLRARGATSLRDALSLAAGVAIAPGGDGGPASWSPSSGGSASSMHSCW